MWLPSRRSRVSVLAASLSFLLSIAWLVPTQVYAGKPGKTIVTVDIDRIGHARLEALKALPSVEWWVEIDDRMLVIGSNRLPAALAGRYTFERVQAGPASAGDFYYAIRLDGGEAAAAGARVLLARDGVVVFQATPAQVAEIGRAHGDHAGEGCRNHSALGPLVPNTALAHQAANDPPPASKLSFDVAIQALVDSVDGNRWYSTNQSLAGYNRWSRGTDILNARDWLVSQFQSMPGLTVETTSFNVPGSPAATAYNVVATLPGAVRPDDWYIVGAHYDAISNDDGHASAHGAEDNGSGTAAVLELARIFTANPPDATIKFICYAGEEQGLYGSIDHASDTVAAGDTSKVKGMFNMDMIGYTGDADLDCRLETRSIGQSLMDALSQAAAQYTTLRIVTSLNPCCSDHQPYLDRGMPAVLSIENDYSSYPGYHRASDLSTNLTIDMAVQIMRMNVATIAQLAGTTPAGRGDDTIGVFVPATSTFFLRNSTTPGDADLAFQFGPAGAGWKPLAGDWNGDGVDTIGLFDPTSSTFFLKNTNGPGGADVVVTFGPAGANWVPLAGDWDGNGTDTVGLYDATAAAFFLRNSLTPGPADHVFVYGPPGATPIAGDWDGDGIDTIGIFAGATAAWFLRNANSSGDANLVFTYGPAASAVLPIPGDWNNDNAQTAGLYDPATAAWFLRDANSAGVGTRVFSFGPPGLVPLRGDWNGVIAKRGMR